MRKMSVKIVWVGIAIMVGASPALAQQCKRLGELAYIGRFDNGSGSVWLSSNTDPDEQRQDFTFAPSQASEFSDKFSIDYESFVVSVSPIVSSGNGGTHKLSRTSDDCLIDTQNQKGELKFRPIQTPIPIPIPAPIPIRPVIAS